MSVLMVFTTQQQNDPCVTGLARLAMSDSASEYYLFYDGAWCIPYVTLHLHPVDDILQLSLSFGRHRR